MRHTRDGGPAARSGRRWEASPLRQGLTRFPKVTDTYPRLARTPGHPTCMVMVGVVSPLAAVSVVCAADTVMAVGLITWLERVAMVPNVVMGVAREALVLWPPAPARLVETVPVTVPRVVTPEGGEERAWDEACRRRLPSRVSPRTGLEGTEGPQWERKAPERAPAPSPALRWQADPKERAKRLHTCGALHNQRGDGWFDGRDSDGGDQADASHGHGAEDSAWLSRGPLQHHLEHQRTAPPTSLTGCPDPVLSPPRPPGGSADTGGKRRPGAPHLGHSLLPVASGNFGDSSDDFRRCSSSRSHNLGGDNGDRRLDARSAGHT